MIALKVLTIGTFDGLHYGHVKLFERAVQFGELHVGVNDDPFVKSYKGRLPEQQVTSRMRVIRALNIVHEVYCNDEAGGKLVRSVLPDILVVGSDWHEKDYLAQIGTTQAELDSLCIAVLYLPRTPGISTTELRDLHSSSHLSRRKPGEDHHEPAHADAPPGRDPGLRQRSDA